MRLTFYEKDVPYYAAHRDFDTCEYCDLQLYSEWSEVRGRATAEARESDIVVTASYCPDGAQISDAVLGLNHPLRVFYDLDTPITLERLTTGPLDYLRRSQIPEFDLYLSFTGGEILTRLEQQYGARLVRPLYGCVDPDVYFRVPRRDKFTCALSFLGTYAPDRSGGVEQLFFKPASLHRDLKFMLAGSLYPADLVWPANVAHIEHVSSGEHTALYSSSRATLNVTRKAMAESGYCPSGRFFEAAACGTPILTDWWEGMDRFFDVPDELFTARTAEDVVEYLEMPEALLREAAERARSRTLEEHTGERRAEEFLAYCEQARRPKNFSVEANA